MSRWEHRYLGQERFPDALSAMEIEHFFTLGEEELVAVRRRRTVLNRLALALQIGFLKMTGGTLNSVEIIPTGVLEHLGRQLRCAPPRIASIRALYRRRRTLFEHQAAALHALGRIGTQRTCRARSRCLSPSRSRRGVRQCRAHGALALMARRSRLSPSARARHPASRRRRAAAPRASSVQNHRRGCRARPRVVAAALAGANRGRRDQPSRVARRRAVGQRARRASKPKSRKSAS